MDLAKIETKEIEKEMTVPGVGRTGFFLTLRYESAPEVQAVSKKYENKLFEEARKGKRADRQAITEWFKRERLIAHIADWRWEGDATYEGEQPKYSKEMARKMVESKNQFSYFLRSFVEEQIGDAADFLEESA